MDANPRFEVLWLAAIAVSSPTSIQINTCSDSNVPDDSIDHGRGHRSEPGTTGAEAGAVLSFQQLTACAFLACCWASEASAKSETRSDNNPR
jgi:hypothetical protein